MGIPKMRSLQGQGIPSMLGTKSYLITQQTQATNAPETGSAHFAGDITKLQSVPLPSPTHRAFFSWGSDGSTAPPVKY